MFAGAADGFLDRSEDFIGDDRQNVP